MLTRGSPWSLYTAARRACWCRICTSGRALSGSGVCNSPHTISPVSGSPWATTTTETPGANSGTGGTSEVVEQRYRILWRLADVAEVVPETPRTKSLVLDVPDWDQA